MKLSMPNIPDISSDNDISLEQAVNLLLTSIAMEEISLSKLMDAETDKIKYVTQMHGQRNTDDLLSVNSSVNTTIMNMIKLQMLLQFKLENVERLLPPKPPCPPPPKPPCPCPPEQQCPLPHKPCCCISGRACGCICHSSGEFSGAEAMLRADIFSNATANNLLSYTVRNCDSSLLMNAYTHNLCLLPFGCEGLGGVVITGNGKAEKLGPNGQRVSGFADFHITIWDSWFKEGFQVTLSSCEPKLNHDSGFVRSKGAKWLTNANC